MSLTTQELQTINSLMMKMSGEDYKKVASMFKHAQSMRQHNAAVALRVGDKVQWNSKFGYVEQGTITKINHKTIKVITASNQQWSCSPSLLSKI